LNVDLLEETEPVVEAESQAKLLERDIGEQAPGEPVVFENFQWTGR